jgi:hypothetical protein
MATCYRADHVGSLLRPAALLEARAAYAEGRLGLDALCVERIKWHTLFASVRLTVTPSGLGMWWGIGHDL